MANTPSNLAWVRSFEAAARHASFSKAAEELGLTQAALSHHIRGLEQECQTKLFVRGRRGVSLTPQGADYLALVQGPLLAITSSTQSVFSGRPKQTVAVTLPPGLAIYWLVPRLDRLLEQMPDLGLSLYTNHVDYSTSSPESDLAIEFNRGIGQGPNTLCLFMDRVTPVCSPSLAKEDWESQPLISVRDGTAPWEDWFRMTGRQSRPNRRLTFDQFPNALEAAKLGLGVLLGPTVLINPTLEQGGLVRLSQSELPSGGGYFLNVQQGRPRTEASRMVADWLIREAAASQ